MARPHQAQDPRWALAASIPRRPRWSATFKGPLIKTPHDISAIITVSGLVRGAAGPRLVNVQPNGNARQAEEGFPARRASIARGLHRHPSIGPVPRSQTDVGCRGLNPATQGRSRAGPHGRGVIKLPTWPVAPWTPSSWTRARSSRFLCTVHIPRAVPREMLQQFVSASIAPLARGLARGCRLSVLG